MTHSGMDVAKCMNITSAKWPPPIIFVVVDIAISAVFWERLQGERSIESTHTPKLAKRTKDAHNICANRAADCGNRRCDDKGGSGIGIASGD